MLLCLSIPQANHAAHSPPPQSHHPVRHTERMSGPRDFSLTATPGRVLPTAVQQWQQALAHVVTGGAFGGAAWAVWIRTIRTSNLGDETATLEIRIAPFQQLVAALLVLAALVHAVQLLQLLRRNAAAPSSPSAVARLKDRP